MAMNPEIKNKWINRLESGIDEQGKGYLNRGGKKCCLGVLCEIAAEEGIVTRGERNVSFGAATTYDDEYSVLPHKVAEWAGVADNNPNLIRYHAASELNDNFEFTFPQIALMIRVNDDL